MQIAAVEERLFSSRLLQTQGRVAVSNTSAVIVPDKQESCFLVCKDGDLPPDDDSPITVQIDMEEGAPVIDILSELPSTGERFRNAPTRRAFVIRGNE